MELKRQGYGGQRKDKAEDPTSAGTKVNKKNKL
jgi:hypothetical protein